MGQQPTARNRLQKPSNWPTPALSIMRIRDSSTSTSVGRRATIIVSVGARRWTVSPSSSPVTVSRSELVGDMCKENVIVRRRASKRDATCSRVRKPKVGVMALFRRTSRWRAICTYLALTTSALACAGRRGPPSGPTVVVPADGGAPALANPDSSSLTAQQQRSPTPEALLPGDRNRFSAAVDKSLPAAQSVARLSGREAAVAAGNLLAALADAVETIPDAKKLAGDHIVEVRFEAKRLQRSDRLAFGVSKWIRLGLASAIDALEAATPVSDTARFWIRLARQTQEAIDVGTTTTFQRAVIQDAIRTTITAFVVVGQGLDVCHGPDPVADRQPL